MDFGVIWKQNVLSLDFTCFLTTLNDHTDPNKVTSTSTTSFLIHNYVGFGF